MNQTDEGAIISQHNALLLLREIKPQNTFMEYTTDGGSSGQAASQPRSGALDTLGNFLSQITTRDRGTTSSGTDGWTFLSSSFIRPSHIVLVAVNGKMLKIRLF